jgi:hypothetical protein
MPILRKSRIHTLRKSRIMPSPFFPLGAAKRIASASSAYFFTSVLYRVKNKNMLGKKEMRVQGK